MPNISVILADADYLVRVGLNHILEKEANIVVKGEVTNEANLSEMMSVDPADVVIMDYNQPGNFSPKSIQSILNKHPYTGILVISADNDKQTVYEVLEYGVTSFLTKSCDAKEIVEGIHAAAKKQRYFCKKVMDYVFERSFSPTAEDCAPLPLTVREIEVVQLTAKGLIAKEIASQLDLSTHTIYTHRKNIMRKLKISTSSELILYAVNNGLLN
ncbi:MAG: response regulator transcription factor [Bacteroidota bacterium]